MKAIVSILLLGALLISCNDEDGLPTVPDSGGTINNYKWNVHSSFDPGSDYKPNTITNISGVTYIGGRYNMSGMDFYLVDSVSLYQAVEGVCYSVPLVFPFQFDYTEVTAVTGTDPNDIWIAAMGFTSDPFDMTGHYAFFFHYNGSAAEQQAQFGGTVEDIHVLGENNILACGGNALYSFNGVQWEMERIRYNIDFKSVTTSDGHTLLLGIHEDDYQLYEYVDNWIVLKETINQNVPAFGAPYFTEVEGLGTLSYGNGIVSLWNGTGHTNILTELNNVTYIGGRDVDNILIINNEEELYHYNGTALVSITEVNELGLHLTQAYANGDEFFVLGNKTNQPYKLLYGVMQ